MEKNALQRKMRALGIRLPSDLERSREKAVKRQQDRVMQITERIQSYKADWYDMYHGNWGEAPLNRLKGIVEEHERMLHRLEEVLRDMEAELAKMRDI